MTLPRVLLPAACALLALAPATFTQAAPAEGRVTGENLAQLLKSDHVWCAEWRGRDTSCEDVGFIDVIDAKTFRQTYRYQLSDSPDLQMIVRQTVQLEGDALCAKFQFKDLDVVVLEDGAPATPESAAPVIAMLADSMSALEGKMTCEHFSRDAASGDLVSFVTLDGEMSPDFDSRYRLLTPDARINLRPLIQPEEESSTTSIA
ncbi:hypothetical protein QO010_000242 [Caulobacter ginsengisoli]|uniref:Uncharacterized protein n=1 Tax=Caulobacter ginsengisoli TaxID=400775 RepID=A0ABU0INB0_9CAUL|nr:hypothetical protein [Caulobacter ginsengisoli]MDQ0462494.1 hypothetical protein [Caulobacter ginsengisoli]